MLILKSRKLGLYTFPEINFMLWLWYKGKSGNNEFNYVIELFFYVLFLKKGDDLKNKGKKIRERIKVFFNKSKKGEK